MKTKFRIREGDVALLIDGKIVARLMRYADTEHWQLTDVRLAPSVTPHEFSFANAEEYWSEYEPRTKEEAEYVKSRLHNYFETDEGKIWYCTYSGIVCSNSTPKCFEKPFDQGGFFSFDHGMRELRIMSTFWNTATDLNVKILNPKLQPTVTQLRFDYAHRLLTSED